MSCADYKSFDYCKFVDDMDKEYDFTRTVVDGFSSKDCEECGCVPETKATTTIQTTSEGF